MLSIEEIKKFISEDQDSEKKSKMAAGERYYEGNHDIKKYRIFYFDNDGNLVEDKTRSNVKIPHPFFTELVDQATQFILSGDEFITSNDPKLQKEMDERFNHNDDFLAELADVITGTQTKGSEFMYAYKGKDDKTKFQCADSLGVIEVRAKDTNDKADHLIWHYIDRVGKNHQAIMRIQVWDAEKTYYYVQTDNGGIEKDTDAKINPKPHIIYQEGTDENVYYNGYGEIPFYRLDNNKKQLSSLNVVKPLIDDYDLMASSLSNNLIDFDHPVLVVKGFEGDNLDELMQNVKTKKLIGMESTDSDAGLDIKTVEIPYQARQAKLELDEKNIYRFGMGLNMAGLKDTSATTNIAIKAAYSLLEMRCKKLETRLKQFLRRIVSLVIKEINEANDTNYTIYDVKIKFEHEIMSNEQENAQNALTDAQRMQIVVNTLLSLADKLDDETLMKNICDALDIDYEEIKDKLPKEDENTPYMDQLAAQGALDGVVTEDEPQREGSPSEGA